MIQPLTTAISTREYEVGGLFNASMTGPEGSDPPEGTLTVGYQIAIFFFFLIFFIRRLAKTR